eukprot:scaffold28182_cov126-Isochrysis_galbana.AAC.8
MPEGGRGAWAKFGNRCRPVDSGRPSPARARQPAAPKSGCGPMDQLPNLPGVQLERKLVSIDDVSDDDDDMGTCAFLFKGAQRKRALEDMQRKKDAALADAAVAARLEAEAAALREEEEDRAGTSSKRSRDTLGGADGAGGQSGAGASAGDALLNAEDAALLEKDRQQQARLREMQAALGSDDDVRPPYRHRHSRSVLNVSIEDGTSRPPR